MVHTPALSIPSQLDEVEQISRSKLQQLNTTSLLELQDVRFWERIGYVSYFGFLVVSIMALYNGLSSSAVGKEGWAKLAFIVKQLPTLFTSPAALWEFVSGLASAWWWLIPAALGCWILAKVVDYQMEKCYSSFWHELRTWLDPWRVKKTEKEKNLI